MTSTSFLLHTLFYDNYKITITEKEISQRLNLPEKVVRDYINHDIEVGMIFEVRSCSTYYLTYKGLGAKAFFTRFE